MLVFLFSSFYLLFNYPEKPKNNPENPKDKKKRITHQQKNILCKKGTLHVFTGPMFSGKTTKLLNELTLLSDLNIENNIVLINHSLDNRDIKNKVSSHSSSYKGLSDNIKIIRSSSLLEIDTEDFDIIGIDEANFYEDLIPAVKLWLDKGIHIYCAGLDGNYKMEKFGHIAELLPISDTFVKLNALCKLCLECGNYNPKNLPTAAFTSKLFNDSELIDIGGSDKYMSVCRTHFCVNN